MHGIISLLTRIYTVIIKSAFAGFGAGSVVKPLLNTTNSHHIYIGSNVNIGSFSWVSVSTSFGGYESTCRRNIRLSIGDNTDIGNNAFIVANNNIDIGSNVIMAPYVYISDHFHEFGDINKNLHDQPITQGGHVRIKDNVFIGIKASILPNVTVGEHSVIGANTVVTKDVPSYSVVVGNPAKIVKTYSFDKRKWI